MAITQLFVIAILGPILYAIFVSPLLDLIDSTLFAIDNYTLEWNTCKEALKHNMQLKLITITKWLSQTGLQINEEKTELQ